MLAKCLQKMGRDFERAPAASKASDFERLLQKTSGEIVLASDPYHLRLKAETVIRYSVDRDIAISCVLSVVNRLIYLSKSEREKDQAPSENGNISFGRGTSMKALNEALEKAAVAVARGNKKLSEDVNSFFTSVTRSESVTRLATKNGREWSARTGALCVPAAILKRICKCLDLKMVEDPTFDKAAMCAEMDIIEQFFLRRQWRETAKKNATPREDGERPLKNAGAFRSQIKKVQLAE